MKKIIFLALTQLAIIGTAQAIPQKSLSFATEATYPPFVYMQPDGKMAGFGADLVHALCAKMNTQCTLVNAPFQSLIPSLQMGKYDALFGGFGITPQREKVVDFSVPYYNPSSVYVIKKNTPFDANHLSHVTIGVQGGSQFQAYLQKTYGNKITIKPYLSNMTALMDLKAGRITAVFIDQPVAKVWLNKSNNAANYTTAGNVVDQAFFGPGDGFAINKSNPALVAQINKALTQIHQDGTYTQLVNKWFGVSHA